MSDKSRMSADLNGLTRISGLRPGTESQIQSHSRGCPEYNGGMLHRTLFLLLMGTILLVSSAAYGIQRETSKKREEAAQAQLRIGADHLQRGEIEQAVRELKRVLALNPLSAAGHMLLGQAYLAQRSISMVAEAKAELQQALDIDPSLLWAHFYLAKVYVDLGQFDKAKRELEDGLDMRPDVPHFLSLLGEVERKLGHPEISIKLNQRALQADPAMTPAYYYMGLAYMDLKKQDEAIAVLESSLKSPYVAPEMYLTLGSLYARKKRYQEGEELCKKAVALDPSRPEGHVNLAQLYNIKGASDQALQELKLALEGKSFPSTSYYQQLQADAYFETGRAYQTKRMTAQAIQAYSTALAFNPNEGRTHRELADLYLRKGDYNRAFQHVLMAEKLGTPVEPSLREEIVQRREKSIPRQL
jgi:tetratricopeptide (TPR) repeat protein